MTYLVLYAKMYNIMLSIEPIQGLQLKCCLLSSVSLMPASDMQGGGEMLMGEVVPVWPHPVGGAELSRSTL